MSGLRWSNDHARAWALEQTPGGGSGRKFLLYILAHHGDEWWSCFPSQARLAEMTDQSVRSVRLHLAALEQDGYIARVREHTEDGRRTTDRIFVRPWPDLALPAEVLPTEDPEVLTMAAEADRRGRKYRVQVTRKVLTPPPVGAVDNPVRGPSGSIRHRLRPAVSQTQGAPTYRQKTSDLAAKSAEEDSKRRTTPLAPQGGDGAGTVNGQAAAAPSARCDRHQHTEPRRPCQPCQRAQQRDSRPPWCGACEDRTRQREDDAGLPVRCPVCHPLAVDLARAAVRP